jgi:hypothetical protein
MRAMEVFLTSDELWFTNEVALSIKYEETPVLKTLKIP